MTQAKSDVAKIFNSTVAANAIGAAWDLGALDELSTHGEILVPDFATRKNLDVGATMAVFRALASVEIVQRHDSKILPGRLFAETYRAKPLFYWLCQGSGELFAKMPELVRNENRNGRFYHRDARAVSHASRAANTEFFDPVFREAMQEMNGGFTTVADLGSGSGERLIQVVQSNPGTRGIGVDISRSTLEMSTAEVTRAGLSDRITFVEADVRDLDSRPEFADVELLTCFMMGHDLWPRDSAVASLQKLRASFPRVRKFLLGDTVRTVGLKDEATPIFTLGFEVGHSLMGVYVPTAQEWLDVFADGGWRCTTKHESESLSGTAVFELE